MLTLPPATKHQNFSVRLFNRLTNLAHAKHQRHECGVNAAVQLRCTLKRCKCGYRSDYPRANKTSGHELSPNKTGHSEVRASSCQYRCASLKISDEFSRSEVLSLLSVSRIIDFR